MAHVAIEFLETKNGSTTARATVAGGSAFLLHSAYDPEAEAERLVAGYPSLANAGGVICLGLGLAYHIEAMLRVVPADTKILVIEVNDQLRERFAQHASTSTQKKVIVAKDEAAAKGYLSLLRERLQERGLVIVEHSASIRLDPEFYEHLRRRIRDHISLLVVELNTLKTVSHIMHANNLENLPAVIADPGIKALKDAFRGRPAVIVAAGPSLSKNIDLLEAVKGRGVIICVGTAWKALLKAGLRPDLVVTLDATEANWRLFAGLTPTEEFLCYEPQVHPAIIPLFEGRRFVFNSLKSPLTAWLRELCGDKGYVEPGGSVAIAAFGIACLLGANPIVFIGQDLAYTDGYTHAKGTAYEDRRFKPTERELYCLEVPAVGGGTVTTTRNLYSFLTRFEELFAQEKDRLIIDATEGGALKRGTKVMTLRETIDFHFTEEFPILPVIANLHRKHQPDPFLRERVRKELDKTAREYMRLIPELAKVLSLAAKAEELSSIAERFRTVHLVGQWTIGSGILATLKQKGQQLTRQLRAVNSEHRLLSLLSLLTPEVELKPLLTEDAPLPAQIERIRKVYASYLQAAKYMCKELERTAARLLPDGGFERDRTLEHILQNQVVKL
ncbi:MAG TPA: DUF115 domain-containing protein [Desulfotomaculum sp.]|nr:DUF115 domain-containing protein [Desulfotomaculum sp.]